MAYQPGDTVHGKVDAHKSQQQEELNEVLRKARTNPWHLFAHGVLHRTDGSGQRMFSTFDDPLVKVTSLAYTLEGDADAPGWRIQLGKLDVSSTFRLFSPLLSESL